MPKEGSCRIKLVRPEEFSVDITTASSDLNDEVNWEEKYSKNNNQYYHVLTAEERKAIESEKRRLARYCPDDLPAFGFV